MANLNKPNVNARVAGPIATSLGNVFVCYALILTFFLAPLALFIAMRFSEPAEQSVFAHFFYIRTTIALLVIGCCVGGLLILLGADLSSSLILVGLAIFVLTGFLTLARCLVGGFCALRGRPPRSYRSYLV
ncbi:hypothetical protein [Roseibium album]|uniref:hypothetical protein n=1 Tax=Roseibium album TaxID=311410 RepID=UPI0024914DE8|nr:hypothetical protein [Roseibium album]